MARRPHHYRVRIAACAVAWVGGCTAFVLLGASWWQLATAVFLAAVFTQIGFLGHDAGHRQVYGSRRADDVLGVLCANAAIGLSYGWWVGKHNRHHAHPNHSDRDPDIGDGALAFTRAQARARASVVGRAVARHQAVLFFPMLLLQGIALHVYSVMALRESYRTRPVEAGLLVAHLVAYVAVVLVVLPPLQALAFVAVHQGLFGAYMGCAFAPNHKGMPVVTDAEQLDYLRRQVLTSRNVSGGRFVDTVLGGLNLQIEHHLFPSMPSPSLRAAAPLVREFCREREVAYTETTLVDSYRQVLRHLRDVGAEAGRGAHPPEPGRNR
ncbi:MAG: acyl-CoA desaturase [Pseudonocardia sp.]|nr:acyl-CoA desaturase [Pseudonocardia sp.]